MSIGILPKLPVLSLGILQMKWNSAVDLFWVCGTPIDQSITIVSFKFITALASMVHAAKSAAGIFDGTG